MRVAEKVTNARLAYCRGQLSAPMDCEALAECLEQLGLNEFELAELLDVGLETVGDWLGGDEAVPAWAVLAVRYLMAVNEDYALAR